ncbi:MAG: hypothetical protein MPJ52_02500, partial [Alphaproteobacteria bacterium]|nr:hypothetical protein [Alphaproteobacteria bacterium]
MNARRVRAISETTQVVPIPRIRDGSHDKTCDGLVTDSMNARRGRAISETAQVVPIPRIRDGSHDKTCDGLVT